MKLTLGAIAVLAGILFGLTLTYGNQSPAAYKVIRLSPTQVGISCHNGAMPVQSNLGDIVPLSCQLDKE